MPYFIMCISEKMKNKKKPGLKPLLPHEVRTVVASSLDKTGSYSCPSSAGFAGTKFDTRMSSSAAVYAVTMSDTCKDSPCVYAETKSNTSKNSPALMYAATKSDTGKKHKKQNSPKDHTTPGGIEFNTSHMQSNSSSQSGYQPTSLKDTHSSSLIHAGVELECLAETCNMGKSWDGARYKTEKVPLWVALELMRMHMEYAHPCNHTPNSTCVSTGNRVVPMANASRPVAFTSVPPVTTVKSTTITSVSKAIVTTANTGRPMTLTSVSMDNTTNSSRHTDSAINSNSRHTEPADTPALNYAGDVWGELSPGSPGLNNDPNPRNTETQAGLPSLPPLALPTMTRRSTRPPAAARCTRRSSRSNPPRPRPIQ